jgi:hypothetical protein
MIFKDFFTFRKYFTSIITIAIWSILLWDHFHGGVPSHHLLQRSDMPAISNWWGGITIPLLTWFLLYRIQQRTKKNDRDSKLLKNIIYAFAGALCYGILLSVFFTFGLSEIPFYMLIGLLVIALFFPIYRAECFLGFVLGMTYTFGGVLPIGVASVLALLGAGLYLVVRFGVRLASSRFTTENNRQDQ